MTQPEPNYHVTDRVPVSRIEKPPTPPDRRCKVCNDPASAGAYLCRECRGLRR